MPLTITAPERPVNPEANQHKSQTHNRTQSHHIQPDVLAENRLRVFFYPAQPLA